MGLSQLNENGFIQYGNKYVDDKFAPVAEENLYYDTIFVPGLTYTDKYQQDDAGRIIVHKAGKSAVVVGTPARDFTNLDVADSVITIALNNNFQQSRKIYRVAANAVSMDLAASEFEAAMEDVQEAWHISGVAALADQATAVVDATVITASNVKAKIIAFRKTLRDAKARANVCLVDTAVYAAILEAAGDDFTPVRNDQIQNTGEVGRWYGIIFIETQQFAEAAAKYYDNAGVLQTVDLTNTDWVMYDYRAYSILDNLESMRLIDSELFTGSLAQIEINSAFQVTNALRAYAKNLT